MKVFALANDFTALVEAMRARRMQLGLSQTDVDHLAELPGGYCSKTELSVTNPTAKNARSIGKDTMPKMLKALGLHFAVLAEADFQAEKFKGLGSRIKLSGEDAVLNQKLKPNRILAERGKKGGQKSWETMTPERREAFLASGAAGRLARWKNRAQLPDPSPPPPKPEPAPPIAPARRESKLPAPHPMSKRKAYLERQRLVAERAAARACG